MNSRKVRIVALAASVLVATPLLAGCGEEGGPASTAEAPDGGLRVVAADEVAPVVVLGSSDPAELTLTASQAFFASAPVVILADAEDETAQAAAAAAALPLHAPVLLTGGAIADSGLTKEIARLGAVTAVVVTPDPAPRVDASGTAGTSGAAVSSVSSSEDLEEEARKTVRAIDPDLQTVLLGAGALVETQDGGTEIDDRDLAEVQEQLPETESPRLLTEVLALVDQTPGQATALATAQAAGVVPLAVPGGDPRASSVSVQAMAQAKALAVVGIGESFGTVEQLTARVRSAETGVELTGGGQLVTAGKRYVVLPGTTVPATPAKITDAVARTAARAEPYVAVAGESGETDKTVTVPTLELVVTEASGAAGKDGNYSTELTVEAVRPAVEAALGAGQHVLLEFQPGKATFVEQVRQYADLLSLPGVGVSLDLDARRASGAVKKDGVVPAQEIDAVVDYLAGVVEGKALPQKMLVVHVSQPGALTEAQSLTTTDDAVAVVLHSDVTGSSAVREKAWNELTKAVPGVSWWGWTDVAGEATAGPAAAAGGVGAPLVVVVE
ncbi:hypothetical protein OERS_05580 [Oerskovia enterophila]|uniref:Lipoprotein n=1 Tax=Oerskovia enterophila TaxID=43678 RepID=A0ABX2Y7Y9_9CELL|nr:hypothetical protein OERS_05580 [Oerskovia enterophila]